MAGRYIITGVQLGMLLAINDKKSKDEIINSIIEKQFIYNSEISVEEDCKIISSLRATTKL
jgi:uncharacterized membrane protein